MRNQLNIKAVGWSVSAILAVFYILVVLASFFLVSFLTTRSWQAVFLGIGWKTIAGFEFGFLGVGLLGFAVASVVAPVYNLVQNRRFDRSKTPVESNELDEASGWTRSLKLWVACLVFPALALVFLRALASISTLADDPGVAGTTAQAPGEQTGLANMGSTINTAHRESEPSFISDGRTMYFNCNSGDICVSRLSGTWEQGNWTPPERLGAPINTEYEEVEPVINSSGDKLYFTSIRPIGILKGIPFLSPFMPVIRITNNLAMTKFGRSVFGGLGLPDVYVSYRVDGAWSEPLNLNEAAGEPPVNTSFDDHCLFFSADGDEAFWTSTRPGGFGDNDIWTARRVGGKWTEPENIGSNINSSGSEHTSIPTPDGKSLYVTSDRPGGYGGDDNYISTRGVDGNWGPLVNLGSMINGSGDDRCPAWTPDYRIFLFDSVREGGFGGRDIWWVYFEDVKGYPLAFSANTYAPDTAP